MRGEGKGVEGVEVIRGCRMKTLERKKSASLCSVSFFSFASNDVDPVSSPSLASRPSFRLCVDDGAECER